VVISQVIATADARRASSAQSAGHLVVHLYDSGNRHLAGLGRQLLDAVFQLPATPSALAWDFLSFALATFAADRFVLRHGSPDGWTRMISLEVDVHDPMPWQKEAKTLAALLRFLTGDIWYVHFRSGGIAVPEFDPSLTDRDCACLFSGGMDSLIGAGDLMASGRRPIVVSQASPKEAQTQKYLAERLRLSDYHFDGRARERFTPPYESSSRARSLLFIAYGALAATSLWRRKGKAVELFIPENGFIAVNPPLTHRRLGSLSTRTTHPFFLAHLQEIFDRIGMGVLLRNPYAGLTKGEMITRCQNPTSIRYLSTSYSCGKGKRLNMHCGRCVPCLIRRAAFHKAGIPDKTSYASAKLGAHGRNDDVFAMRYAVAKHRLSSAHWAGAAGPLPTNPADAQIRRKVVGRGLTELQAFLSTVKWS
jgi:7-cyano-7-deazaguanine synthase in queuosine biosynthesis